MNNLISIIVPVYNVESYLDQCVESITCQTHTDLEIILVDDCSPDRCGKICDDWGRKDHRIKIMHLMRPTGNHGPSGARNAGLDIATGEYIGFVDSDDWIEPGMYERLLNAMLETSADISVCGIEHMRPAKTVRRTVGSPLILDREAALKTLLADRQIQNYAWDKLYRSELFSNVRFPNGKTFEDVFVQYRLFEKCKTVTVIPDVLYHYRRRMDSIVGPFQYPQRLTFCMAIQERWEDLAKRHPELISNLAMNYVAVVALVAKGLAALEPKDAKREAAAVSANIAPFWNAHREEIHQLSDNQEQVQRLELFIEASVSTVAGRKKKIVDVNVNQFWI